MIILFTALTILAIVKSGWCSENQKSSDYVIGEDGAIPTADLVTGGHGADPTQSPDRFRFRPGKPRIIGGEETDIKKYPFVVSISIFGKHMCGGTYIHVGWVLTAAHCLRMGPELQKEIPPEPITLKMGSADLTADTVQVRNIKQVFTHPQYTTDTNVNDIGLLKLTEAFYLGPTTDLVKLPSVGTSYDNYNCSVVGWGITKEEDSDDPSAISKKLLKVDLPIITLDDCQKGYSGIDISDLVIPGLIICAGLGEGKDACQGDSGGPLTCDGVQVGVVSWGIGCGRRLPGIYTRVSRYVAWINDVVARYPDLRNGGPSTKISLIFTISCIIFLIALLN